MRSESKRSRRKCGEGVAKNGERFSALQAIREMTGGKFCETGESVRDAFDRAKPYRARTNRGEKRGEHGGGGFVTPIAEEAGETDAEDGAVEPTLLR